MQLKFQYNKTALQTLKKELSIREKALPTLKSKEAALRLEVKRRSEALEKLREDFDEELRRQASLDALWVEFPDIVRVKEAVIITKKIAGVKAPLLEDVSFDIADFMFFNAPAWLPYGVERLKSLMKLTLEIEVMHRQIEALNYGRKKTTQKVNLYEKVQIPAYKEATLKIKRFMEDEDNLTKSAQKIVKERNRAKEAELL